MRILTVLLFLLTLPASAQRLVINQLTPKAFVFTTWKQLDGKPYPSNGMYLVDDSGVVIIDSPWDTTQCQPLLDSIRSRHGQKAVMCIATHFHDDRTGAFRYFRTKGIANWSTHQTRELCRVNKERQAEFVFRSDTTFTIGNLQLATYYPGKGHTGDNIVIWIASEKILYGGCLVKSMENNSIGYIIDSDMAAWPQAVTRVKDRYPQARFVIPGHFAWGDKRLFDHTIKLIKSHPKNRP